MKTFKKHYTVHSFQRHTLDEVLNMVCSINKAKFGHNRRGTVLCTGATFKSPTLTLTFAKTSPTRHGFQIYPYVDYAKVLRKLR